MKKEANGYTKSGQINEWMDGCLREWMEGWRDGWMNEMNT